VSRADIAAGILWVGATFYALFGGADFGAGFWDLIAGDAEKGARPRALIQRSLTPVWEANHVWLIFILVVLWTAFPAAFSAIMSTLYIPLALAAVGIVLRGTGFVAGLAAVAGLIDLRSSESYVYNRLVDQGLPLIILSAICGIAVVLLLVRGRPRLLRPLSAAAVVAVVWGWGVAQFPYLLPTSLTISAGAAPGPTLTAVLVVFVVAAVVVLPSLGLLYTLSQRDLVGEDRSPT
jgi:cytochrome bd-type quinol oxidase subunit 2